MAKSAGVRQTKSDCIRFGDAPVLSDQGSKLGISRRRSEKATNVAKRDISVLTEDEHGSAQPPSLSYVRVCAQADETWP